LRHPKDWYEDPDAVVARIERELSGDDAEDDSGIDTVIADIEAAGFEPTRNDAPQQEAPAASLPVPTEAPKVASSAVPLSALPPGATRCFEFVEGGSRKVWHVSVDASELVVSFGRIGTPRTGEAKDICRSGRSVAGGGTADSRQAGDGISGDGLKGSSGRRAASS
jgi:hypothetical protein